MQVQFLPGAHRFPDDVKVAWPPVKRLVVVRVHVGEPFHSARMVQKQHIWVSTRKARRDTGCGCPFPCVAQKQSARLITARPWGGTTLKDHSTAVRWLANGNGE